MSDDLLARLADLFDRTDAPPRFDVHSLTALPSSSSTPVVHNPGGSR